MGSFSFGLTSKDVTEWKSTGIYNYLSDSNMNAVVDSGGYLPDIKNDGRMHVYLNSNHFQQNKVIIPNNNNAINIYCVYKLDPIASSPLVLLYKMLYLELCKLLKMLLIIQKIIIKDMVYVLMKKSI